jgi:hypothetical protein
MEGARKRRDQDNPGKRSSIFKLMGMEVDPRKIPL